MKKNLLVVLISVLIITACQTTPPPQPDTASKTKDNKPAGPDYHKFHYASSQLEDSYPSLKKQNKIPPTEEKIYGGIVSHHFFIEPEIAKFFQGLENQPPQTVVIIGPNHFNAGENNILVSRYPYFTPWGLFEPNRKIIDYLIAKKVVSNEERPFEKEHSISVLVGFARYSFPNSLLIPIILKPGTSRAELDKLVFELSTILPEDSLVIASLDFSHHLNRFAADFHDQKSISTIKNFDLDNLYNLEIDSPATLYTLLKYLENKGAQKMIYTNTNSATFSENKVLLDDVTSYLFAYFLEGDPAKEENISILNFGDVMFDRLVKKYILEGNNPFAQIIGPEGNFFKGVDFINVNLEGPITANQCLTEKSISFKFPTTTARILAENKIDILNLANNHSYDCGQPGLIETKQNLKAFNLDYFGDERLGETYLIKEVNGQKIIFYGLNLLFHPSQQYWEEVYKTLKDLKSKADYVVVSVHWGNEYQTQASKSQKDFAYGLIDNGADAVIGHHPHVVQPLEIYRNKAIFYSLGNFLFDQILPGTNEGIGAGVVFDKDKTDIYIFPYEIINFQPTFLNYNQTVEFCKDFLTDIETKDGCHFIINNK